MSLVNIQKVESFPINGLSSYSPQDSNNLIVFDITGSENRLIDMGSRS